MILHIAAPDFSLQHTLESGQAFRWKPSAYGGYYGFIPVRSDDRGQGGVSRAVRVVQECDQLSVHTVDASVTDEHLRRYFDLDADLGAILSSVDVDGQIHDAIARFRGMRVLRQDPWECLAAFICSSFNNIKRIEGMIERLSDTFGEPASFNGYRGCTFPSASALAVVSERRLRTLGLGFRAKYLRAAARMVAAGGLPFDTLRRVDYVAAKSALMQCDGVGEKVADCIALFALQKYEAFPVDVWVARSMRYYFKTARVTPKRIGEFARTHFGSYAGYAQQYLYHYARTARPAGRASQVVSQPSSPTH